MVYDDEEITEEERARRIAVLAEPFTTKTRWIIAGLCTAGGAWVLLPLWAWLWVTV